MQNFEGIEGLLLIGTIIVSLNVERAVKYFRRKRRKARMQLVEERRTTGKERWNLR